MLSKLLLLQLMMTQGMSLGVIFFEKSHLQQILIEYHIT
jgi:hypothetical protein